MSDTLASFRELKGIGPATEARLHETGIYTWDALATAAAALAAARGHGDTFKHVLDEVAKHRGDDEAVRTSLPGNGERLESFVLRLSVTPDGQARRSQLTHVRTMAVHDWAGWLPTELASAVEQESGVSARSISRRPVGLRAGSATASTSTPRRTAAARTSASSDHVLLLDAGKAIGGVDRDITLLVGNTKAARGDFGYSATLTAKRLGEESQGGGAWTSVGSHNGIASAAEEVALEFPAVHLPQGIHRLRLRLELHLSAPARQPPALTLA